MKQQISLIELLKAYEDKQISAQDKFTIHPAPETIRNLALGSGMPDRDRKRLIQHLADCGRCRKIWSDRLVELSRGYDISDTVVLKAAAAKDQGLEDVIKVTAERGTYRIVFRRKLESGDEYLADITALKDWEKFEGRTVEFRDRTGICFLRETMRNGKAVGWVQGLSDLDLSYVSILPEEADHE